MPNLDLELKTDLSDFRRVSIGTWRTSDNPSVYGTLQVKMDRALDYIAEFRKKTGRRLTVTHMVARAVAEALREMPNANAILRFNRIYLRKRISIFMQVAMPEPEKKRVDLSGVTLYDVADKTLVQIVDEVEDKIAAVRERRDPHLERSRGMMRAIPAPLLNLTLRFLTFLSLDLNLDLSRFGIPSDAFGSVMITNIGSLGLDQAYAPLVTFSKVPIVLAVGEVRPTPVVEEGKVVVRQVMKINATFDHRFIDGYHGAEMAQTARRWLEQPQAHFGPVSQLDDRPAGKSARVAAK